MTKTFQGPIIADRAHIRFNEAVKRAQTALGPEAAWRDPIHGHRVLVTPSGQVAGIVKLLNHRWPKRDQRYSARIDGVEWWTTNILSDEPRFLPLRGFSSAKEAMRAVEEARHFILTTDADER